MSRITTLLFLCVTVTTASVNASLVADFSGNGNALDSSVNQNNGTFTGTYVPGALGQAFDLSSAKMTAPDIAAYTLNDFTVDFWVDASSYSNETFLGQDNGPGGTPKWFISLAEFGTNSLEFHTNGNGSEVVSQGVPVTLTPDVWNNIALTKNGTQYSFYLNGNQVGSTQTGLNGLPDPNAPLALGYAEPGYSFSGYMQQVQLYNTGLAASQIQALAAVPEPASISLLVGCLALLPRRRRRSA